jgi:hypothetical protein
LARVVSAEMQQPADLDRCVAKGHSLTKDMWRAIRSLRRRIKIIHPMDFPPSGHSTLEQAVSSFIKGSVKEADDAINHPGTNIESSVYVWKQKYVNFLFVFEILINSLKWCYFFYFAVFCIDVYKN